MDHPDDHDLVRVGHIEDRVSAVVYDPQARGQVRLGSPEKWVPTQGIKFGFKLGDESRGHVLRRLGQAE